MSKYRIKTKSNTEGAWGVIEEEYIYAHHNLSADYVDFYDSHGEHIMTVPDNIDNNILDAINRLYSGIDKEGGLINGVESMTKSDCEKCKI